MGSGEWGAALGPRSDWQDATPIASCEKRSQPIRPSATAEDASTLNVRAEVVYRWLDGLLVLVAPLGCATTDAPVPVARAAWSTTACVDAPSTGRGVPIEPEGAPGWLGIEIAAKDSPEPPATLVHDVTPGSPAAVAGVCVGDELLSIAGSTVSAPSRASTLVAGLAPGQSVGIGLVRRGSRRLVRVSVEERPSFERVMELRFVGKAAPTLEGLRTPPGLPAGATEGLRGKVAIIAFWATRCLRCQVALRVLSRLHDELAERGFTIVAVTTDSAQEARQTATQLRIPYPITLDPDQAATVSYRAWRLPAFYVVDHRGVIRRVLIGYSEEHLSEARALVEELLEALH